MNFKSRNESGIIVIEVNGRLTAENTDEFTAFAMPKVTDKAALAIDLSGMEYIDSTGLGALVALLQKVSGNGGKLALAAPQAKPRVVFDITRADKVFDIFANLDDAIEKMRG